MRDAMCRIKFRNGLLVRSWKISSRYLSVSLFANKNRSVTLLSQEHQKMLFIVWLKSLPGFYNVTSFVTYQFHEFPRKRDFRVLRKGFTKRTLCNRRCNDTTVDSFSRRVNRSARMTFVINSISRLHYGCLALIHRGALYLPENR